MELICKCKLKCQAEISEKKRVETFFFFGTHPHNAAFGVVCSYASWHINRTLVTYNTGLFLRHYFLWPTLT